ncbi:hypothetical protein RRG08_018308 [Elysia crispata]|uniref:Uncharacterized protein n=1 Tax=Elysia crispata TaxID=231223 RepID=A0AAE0XMF0_9GAST|nr:hypothetical protein RRG08_018308 [Elysia crispata]
MKSNDKFWYFTSSIDTRVKEEETVVTYSTIKSEERFQNDLLKALNGQDLVGGNDSPELDIHFEFRGSDVDGDNQKLHRNSKLNDICSPELSDDDSPKLSDNHSPELSDNHSSELSDNHSPELNDNHSPELNDNHSPDLSNNHSP